MESKQDINIHQTVDYKGESLQAKSGLCSYVDKAVHDDCHPETYTVSGYLAIWVTCYGIQTRYAILLKVSTISPLSSQ